MRIKGTYKANYNFFLIYTENENTISDFIDVGLSAKAINRDKFETMYFKNADVQKSFKHNKVDPFDIKIELVKFDDWIDNFDEQDYFFDANTNEYQGKPQLDLYLNGTSEKNDMVIDTFSDLYGKDVVDQYKKMRGLESMEFKSQMMKSKFRNITAKRKVREEDAGKEDDKSSKAIADLIALDWGKDEDSQNTALALLKGLVYADTPSADKFLSDVSDFTNDLDPEDYK